MKSRYTFFLSLLLTVAFVTAAQADPKYVSSKQPTPAQKKKEVKREQVEKRQQTPPPPERVRRGDSDARKDAPPPPQKGQRPAPDARRDNGRKDVKRAPQPGQEKPRYGGGEVAPQTRREPMVQREWPDGKKPEPPKPTGPMPTFLKDRPAETLKKELPKQQLQGTIESIQGEKAVVRTRDGRRAVVQIGPEDFRKQKNIRLERGQEVTVDGWGEWGNGGDRAQGEGFFFAGGIYGPGYHFEFADNDGYPYWADPDDYWDGWYPSWDAYYIYFWGPPPWWAYAPPPWYYRPPYWWHRHYTYYNDPWYGPRHHRHHHRW